MLQPADQSQPPVDFVDVCQKCREKICQTINVLQEQTSDGELAAFIAYAMAFPSGFLALVDTYEVLKWVSAPIIVSPAYQRCESIERFHWRHAVRIAQADLDIQGSHAHHACTWSSCALEPRMEKFMEKPLRAIM